MEYKKDWGPGYRFFICENCRQEWLEKSRHCESNSCDFCVCCGENCQPIGHEKHYEWETDGNGNLI